MSVTLDDVRSAADLLEPIIRRTPTISAGWVEKRFGVRTHFKAENMQRAGSFKIRGAYNRIARLTDEEKSRGVVAASAGNHAQGVALAAQLLGIKATIFSPVGAPLPKVQATIGYGAEVRLVGAYLDESLIAAQNFANETGAIFIHPFDHPDVVAGQGTLGLEVLQQVPELQTMVVCLGGGGLLAGTALAIKELRPDVRVIGVQAERAAAYPASLAAGQPMALAKMDTMADGIAVGKPGEVPFRLIEKYVDEVRTVSEDAMARATLRVLERSKLLAEPAGIAAVAAIFEEPQDFTGPVVATISGGNVDPLLISRILQHGLTAAGRFTLLKVRIPDTPGSLAKLLTDIGQTRANVVHVVHKRLDPQRSVHEVDVEIEVETRGAEHREIVISTLIGLGHILHD